MDTGSQPKILEKFVKCVLAPHLSIHENISGNNDTTYGKESELRAIKDFEKGMNLNVSQCSLFVDEEHFCLGASPDGLVGEHDIIEIKFPYSIVKMSPTEAILKEKIKFAILVDNSLHLKRNHDYYYQVQGQLAITRKRSCYFVLSRSTGILCEQIFYDQQFWQEMAPKVRKFYEQSMFPELVEPLFPIGLPISGNVQYERGPFLLKDSNECYAQMKIHQLYLTYYMITMASKRVTTFSAIGKFSKNDMSQLQRGENFYESGNIVRMLFDAEVSPALLREVSASMKKRNYTVEISYYFDDGIVAAKCTCPRGQVICHHMAAPSIHAHHNVSVTNKTCIWNKRKTSYAEQVTKIKDIYKPKRLGYTATQRKATSSEIDAFKN
nr:unnamed protein product [Callosobruchus analis]